MAETTKKTTSKKPAAATKAVVKKRAVTSTATKAKKPAAVKPQIEETASVVASAPAVTLSVKPTIDGGKYVPATGRRKTAIANVRLFSGKGERTVNKKAFDNYFSFYVDQQTALKPLVLTGLEHDFHFTVNVTGGGIHAQAQAVQHGITKSLAELAPELRKILKKNGLLTRDDRKKERKKPGLKRARRSPQWAKR